MHLNLQFYIEIKVLKFKRRVEGEEIGRGKEKCWEGERRNAGKGEEEMLGREKEKCWEGEREMLERRKEKCWGGGKRNAIEGEGEMLWMVLGARREGGTGKCKEEWRIGIILC